MTFCKIVLAAALTCAAAPALAAETTVKMLNNGPGGMMVFDPSFVKIEPGDTVKFVATDKGHNVETIKGMAPEGAPPVKSKLGQDETVTFEKDGVYGFKCAPHFIMGMAVIVAVGSKLENLDQAKAADIPKGARARVEPLLAKAEEAKAK